MFTLEWSDTEILLEGIYYFNLPVTYSSLDLTTIDKYTLFLNSGKSLYVFAGKVDPVVNKLNRLLSYSAQYF